MQPRRRTFWSALQACSAMSLGYHPRVIETWGGRVKSVPERADACHLCFASLASRMNACAFALRTRLHFVRS